MEDGAPLVHDDFGTNISSVWGFDKGDSPAPHKSSKPFFDDPDLVKVKHRFRLRRLIPNAMEPRGVLVDPNVAMGEYTMYTASQIPHIVRTAQAITCGIPEAKLRVVAPGRGRRLRLEARHVRRGVDLPRPGPPAEPPDQVDRGALGGLRGHDPRARPLHRHGDGQRPATA